MEKYRLIVGEVGNEQGHVLLVAAKTERGAKMALRRELAKYGNDGWGRIEVNYNDSGWQRLSEN